MLQVEMDRLSRERLPQHTFRLKGEHDGPRSRLGFCEGSFLGQNIACSEAMSLLFCVRTRELLQNKSH